jgi:hypothetical protein
MDGLGAVNGLTGEGRECWDGSALFPGQQHDGLRWMNRDIGSVSLAGKQGRPRKDPSLAVLDRPLW